MRIEVQKRKANIVTLCDDCKVKLTSGNTAYHAHADKRHGIMTGLALTVHLSSNEFARIPVGVEGELLNGETDLCKKCHTNVIKWYLEHLEPGSSI